MNEGRPGGRSVVKAGLAEDMFEAARRWLGHLPGGVGMATITACGGFAAMCFNQAGLNKDMPGFLQGAKSRMIMFLHPV